MIRPSMAKGISVGRITGNRLIRRLQTALESVTPAVKSSLQAVQEKAHRAIETLVERSPIAQPDARPPPASERPLWPTTEAAAEANAPRKPGGQDWLSSIGSPKATTGTATNPDLNLSNLETLRRRVSAHSGGEALLDKLIEHIQVIDEAMVQSALRNLEAEIASFVGDSPYIVVLDVDGKSGPFIFEMMKLTPPPARVEKTLAIADPTLSGLGSRPEVPHKYVFLDDIGYTGNQLAGKIRNVLEQFGGTADDVLVGLLGSTHLARENFETLVGVQNVRFAYDVQNVRELLSPEETELLANIFPGGEPENEVLTYLYFKVGDAFLPAVRRRGVGQLMADGTGEPLFLIDDTVDGIYPPYKPRPTAAADAVSTVAGQSEVPLVPMNIENRQPGAAADSVEAEARRVQHFLDQAPEIRALIQERGWSSLNVIIDRTHVVSRGNDGSSREHWGTQQENRLIINTREFRETDASGRVSLLAQATPKPALTVWHELAHLLQALAYRDQSELDAAFRSGSRLEQDADVFAEMVVYGGFSPAAAWEWLKSRYLPHSEWDGAHVPS
jgi:hypothetical protein